MSNYNLEELLGQYAKKPSLPMSFSTDVLREIRLRKERMPSGWLSDIYIMLFRPGLLATSFAFSIAVGLMLPPMLNSSNSQRTADGLGLSIFSSAGHNVPSGLLAKR